ncbi:hypothetical protein LMG27952_07498 [Paraburkholderia hiiakae]|uniref:Uncharacterized protein n=1 Tax=Paraburkholderia hiiakae TaxID=1081782 RepID=A0ABN7IIT9_9BURK|nr:hypothetical protein LMG27952_07498 [Paraburkholderia hiiakae]
MRRRYAKPARCFWAFMPIFDDLAPTRVYHDTDDGWERTCGPRHPREGICPVRIAWRGRGGPKKQKAAVGAAAGFTGYSDSAVDVRHTRCVAEIGRFWQQRVIRRMPTRFRPSASLCGCPRRASERPVLPRCPVGRLRMPSIPVRSGSRSRRITGHPRWTNRLSICPPASRRPSRWRDINTSSDEVAAGAAAFSAQCPV